MKGSFAISTTAFANCERISEIYWLSTFLIPDKELTSSLLTNTLLCFKLIFPSFKYVLSASDWNCKLFKLIYSKKSADKIENNPTVNTITLQVENNNKELNETIERIKKSDYMDRLEALKNFENQNKGQ